MIKRFLGALQFLTILPIPGDTAPASESAIFFPLVGALLGASAGAILLTGNALLVIAWLLIATGCIHEDGLADVADAFRAGRSREKDSVDFERQPHRDLRLPGFGDVSADSVADVGTNANQPCLRHDCRAGALANRACRSGGHRAGRG